MVLQTISIDGTKLLFRSDTHDFLMIDEIWNKMCYSKHFPKGSKSVIVDIGAHNGYFSLFAAKYSAPGSTIYSYEPVKYNFDLLIRNIGLNNIKSITPVKKAVSNARGNVSIFINDSHTGGHSVFRDRVEVYHTDNIQKVVVPCISLTDVVPQDIKSIDFCKIDCEGGEFDILASVDKQQLRKVKIFAIEFHEFGGHTVLELQKKLISCGYSVEISYTPSKRGIIFGILHAVRLPD